MKKCLLISFCVLIITNTTTAQESKTFNNLGFYYSPVFQFVEKSEQMKLNLAGNLWGLGTKLKISNNFSSLAILKIGNINYLFNEYDYNWGTMLVFPPVNTYSCFRIQTSLNLDYLLINSIDRFGSIYISTGLLANIHANEKVTYFENNNISKTNQIRFFNAFIILKTGYERNITNKIALSLDYYFGIRISQNYTCSFGRLFFPLTYREWDNGFNLGVIYKW
jgi:hypothetical protein